MSMWLVTWEWAGEHAKVENKIAAVLNYRFSEERVRKIAELLYANESYTLRMRLACAKNKKNNPYPAAFNSKGGVPMTSWIICGHNPYIYARRVDDLHIDVNEKGEEFLVWKERDKPPLEWLKA